MATISGVLCLLACLSLLRPRSGEKGSTRDDAVTSDACAAIRLGIVYLSSGIECQRQNVFDSCPGLEARVSRMKGAVLYPRVSSVDQTVTNQERELRQTKTAGRVILHVYRGHGISGAKGSAKRPPSDALHKAAARR